MIRTSVVESFKIPTSSMEGTLLVGDFLLVNKVVYGVRIPGTDLGAPCALGA
ncbi:MAG: S26 family signal peptidase [Longimicrobiales bacterium]